VLVVSAIEYTVELLLTQALSPVIAAIDGYVALVNDTLAAAYAAVANGSQVSLNQAEGVYEALGGSVFQDLVLVSAVVEAALLLLSPVDLGPEFIATVLISLIATAALHRLSVTFSGPEESELESGLTAPAIHATEDVVNSTPASQDPSAGPGWQTLLEVALYASKLFVVPIVAILEIARAQGQSSPLVPVVFAALGSLSIILVGWALSQGQPSLLLVLVSTALSAISLYKAIGGVVVTGGEQISALYAIDAAVSSVGLGLDFYSLYKIFS
jgi:hypothetical protein